MLKQFKLYHIVPHIILIHLKYNNWGEFEITTRRLHYIFIKGTNPDIYEVEYCQTNKIYLLSHFLSLSLFIAYTRDIYTFIHLHLLCSSCNDLMNEERKL